MHENYEISSTRVIEVCQVGTRFKALDERVFHGALNFALHSLKNGEFLHGWNMNMGPKNCFLKWNLQNGHFLKIYVEKL